jgi:PAS domain S-box-containing protein
MLNFAPRTRVTLGLLSLLVSSMMLAMVLRIVPDRREAMIEGRARLCEAIAVNSSVLVNRKDINRLQAILTVLVARHDDIQSAGIRHIDGKLIVEIGDHENQWAVESAGLSDDSQVFVPIMIDTNKWGGLEIRFTPLHGSILFEAIHNPWVRLIVFVTLTCALCWYFYLGKVLQQLNPSHAVPGRVRSALDTLAEGLLVLDKKARIVLCNQALIDTLGLDQSKLIGKNARTLPWKRVNEMVDTEFPWERTLAGDTRHTAGESIKLTDINGDEHTYQTNCSPVLGAETQVRGVVCSFEDVTELEAQKSELADSKAEAQAANEAKSAFLANMSHEIRTPMNAILGFTEVLRRGMFETPEQQAEYLETIHTSSQHLLHLINDILDLSKVEAGHLETENIPCSAHQLLLDVATVLQVKANEKGLKLECNTPGGIPEIINTDPARLRQVITNLVGNAIKFTSDGGVSIRARSINTDDRAQLQIDIVDTGVGISENAQGKIFDPFTQADGSITRKFGGTGLGLTISRRFAEALGGGLSVSSIEGKGSTFTVKVDVGQIDSAIRVVDISEFAERVKQAEAPTKANRSFQFAGQRVLLVDDGDANRELIQLVLQRAGLLIETAVNGGEAVDKARAADYDVILMDMQMPIMDGYTATRILRKDGLEIPIIALTANAMRGDEEKCVNAGCSHFLSKPVDLDALQVLIAELLDADEVTNDIGPSVPSSPTLAPLTPAISMSDGVEVASMSSSSILIDEPPITAHSKPNETTSAAIVPAIATPDPTPPRQELIRPAEQSVSKSDRLDDLMKSVEEPTKEVDSTKDFVVENLLNASGSEDSLPPIISTLPTDDAEFHEIVVGFVAKLKEEVAKLVQAWERRDLEEVATLAHWLKGAAGTVGFREFTDPGIALMTAARENQTNAIDKLLDTIVAMTGRIEIPELADA